MSVFLFLIALASILALFIVVYYAKNYKEFSNYARKKIRAGFTKDFSSTYLVWLPPTDHHSSDQEKGTSKASNLKLSEGIASHRNSQSGKHPSTKNTVELNVFTGTWNVGDSQPPYSILHHWLTFPLLPENYTSYTPLTNIEPKDKSSYQADIEVNGTTPLTADNLIRNCSDFVAQIDQNQIDYDIIAIGCQECYYTPRRGFISCEQDWLDAVRKAAGENYELVNYSNLRDSIRLIVLVHRRWVDLVHSVKSSSYSTTVPVFWRKGGIGVQMTLLDKTLCFINCHLSAHESELENRNSDISEILRTLDLGNPNFDVGNQFHHAWLFGDMNYRVTKTLPKACSLLIDRFNHRELLKEDQLIAQINEEQILCGWKEEPINFPPTYKIVRGSRIEFDLKRRPSWCDRILAHSLPDCHLHFSKYGSCDTLLSSDHAPVYALSHILLSKNHPHYKNSESVRQYLKQLTKNTIVSIQDYTRQFEDQKLQHYQIDLSLIELQCNQVLTYSPPSSAPQSETLFFKMTIYSPVLADTFETSISSIPMSSIPIFTWDHIGPLELLNIPLDLIMRSHLFFAVYQVFPLQGNRQSLIGSAVTSFIALPTHDSSNPLNYGIEPVEKHFEAPVAYCSIKKGKVSGKLRIFHPQ